MSDRSRSGETIEPARARSQLRIPGGNSKGGLVEPILLFQGHLPRFGP